MAQKGTSSEYINTDEEGDQTEARQMKNRKKSEERKVVSQQNFNDPMEMEEHQMNHFAFDQNYNIVSNDIDPMAAFSENENDYPNSRQKSKSRKSRGENSTSQKRNKKMSAGRQYYNGGSSQNAINQKQSHSKRQSMGSVERKEKSSKAGQG